MSQSPEPSQLRRLLARCWYAWGMSLCYYGNLAAERSMYQGGVRAFQRAIRNWPDFALAYYRSGLIRGRELGEYSAALVDLGRAIRIAPEWADPYLQRGLFHRFHGDYPAAIADLERYLSLAGTAEWRHEAQHQLDQARQEQQAAQRD